MFDLKIVSKDYYSNCLIEAVKAKIKDHNVKIIIFLPWNNEIWCPHFMWYDGTYVYDFGIEKRIPWIAAWTIHKGHIRKRPLNHLPLNNRLRLQNTKAKKRWFYVRRIS